MNLRTTNENRNRACPQLRRFIAIMILALLFQAVLQATIMKFLDIEDLTRLSTHVFAGQVLSVNSYWSEDRSKIYTAIRLRIAESLRGDAQTESIITVTQLGGEMDGMRLDYSGRPLFAKGENVVLFAKQKEAGDFMIVGLKQGKMKLDGEQVARDFSELTLVSRTSNGRIARTISNPPTKLTLAELRYRVARAR